MIKDIPTLKNVNNSFSFEKDEKGIFIYIISNVFLSNSLLVNIYIYIFI